MDTTYVGVLAWVECVRSWLEGHEPAVLKELPLLLHAPIVWVVGAGLAVSLAGVVLALGAAASGLVMFGSRFVAVHLGGRSIDVFARLVVAIESIVGRWGLFISEDSSISPWDGVAAQTEYVAYFGRRPISRALQLPAVLLGGALWFGLFVTVFLATSFKNLVRAALRPSLGSVSGWLFTVWYFQWFDEMVDVVRSWRFPTVSAGQVAATMTLIVLIYIALGRDIRGKAEINKHASVEVRRCLLSTRHSLDTAADAIQKVRYSAQRALDRFPSSIWLVGFSGNRRVRWRLSAALHPSRWHNNARVSASLAHNIDMVLLGGPEVTAQRVQADREQRESDSRDHDVLRDRQAIALSEADDQLQETVQKLLDDGIFDKLPTVLAPQFSTMWIGIVSGHLELDRVISLPRAGDDDWLSAYSDNDALRDLRDDWVEAPFSNREPAAEIEDLCRRTGYLLRHATRAAYEDLWWLAITEYRLRAVERNIASMIHPSALSRLHQAIGK